MYFSLCPLLFHSFQATSKKENQFVMCCFLIPVSDIISFLLKFVFKVMQARSKTFRERLQPAKIEASLIGFLFAT